LNVRDDQMVTLIDRRGTIVARSQRHNEVAGTQILVPVSLPLPSITRGVNREGIAFHWFNRQCEIAGWIVSIGIPDYVLEAPSKLAIASFATAGTLLLFLAILLAYHWGGHLSQSIGALGIDRKPTREEFEVLFDSAPNGVVVADNDGLIILLNERMEKKFGYTHAELIGRSVDVLVPERFRGAHSQFRKSFAQHAQARPMGAGRDLFGRRKDGTEFPVEIGINPISTSAGSLVMVTVVDISARKLAAEKLAATTIERDDLRRRFMQAQEQERLRLAHELHDQTGQSLTAVLLELKGLESSVSEADRVRIRLLRLQLEQMGETLHHVAWELRPASINELGLASALANYVLEWSEQYGIEADFHCGYSKLDELSDEIRTTIYRVVQEGLTNIAKHARGATSVSVDIERTEATVRLMIEDNGEGFDTTAQNEPASDRGGLGLAGMRERLLLVGGALEIESSAGAGTTVFALIPLERERTAA
jgi:PAS domain S-box-containing protein